MPNTIEHTAARDLADRIDNGSVTIVHISPRMADCDKGRALVVKALRAYKKPRAPASEGVREKALRGEIWCLREVVRGVRIMANAGAFSPFEGEAWLKRVRNIDLYSDPAQVTAPEPADTAAEGIRLKRAWDMLMVLAVTPVSEWRSKTEIQREIQWMRPAPADTPDEGPDPLGYAKGERA